jgi:NADH-quinone oxidoreductase subunit K
MFDITLEKGLVLSILLFLIGVYGFLQRKNLILILMSLEIMFNAVGIAFVLASAFWSSADGQIMFLFILTVAAAEVAVGLAVVVQYFQSLKTLNIDASTELKG